MSSERRVYLVDDDQAVLKSVGRLLRSHGFAAIAFDSSAAFLGAHDPGAHGCVVLDFDMPTMNGLEVQRRLANIGCARPVIFLTGQADIPITVEAMKGGAVDFLTKPVEEGALLRAVNAAIEEDRRRRETASDLKAMRDRLETLTPREREVMSLVVEGLLNKQIALELGTVEKTVKVHRARVMEKMGVDSLAALVRVAASLGVCEFPNRR